MSVSIEPECCTCEDKPMLNSPVSLYCGTCGRRLVSCEAARRLDITNSQQTGDNPAALQEGRLQEAAKLWYDSREQLAAGGLWSRRDFLNALGAAVAAVLVAPVGELLLQRLGLVELDEEKRLKVTASTLLDEHVRIVESAIEQGEDLHVLANTFIGDGKYAAELFAEQAIWHTEGLSPVKAAANNRQLLLSSVHSPYAEARVRFWLSRALASSGQIREALQELDGLLESPALTDSIERARYLRQAVSHSYIMLPLASVGEPSTWLTFRRYLNQLLSLLGLMDTQDLDPDDRTDMALRFDPFIGPAALIFEATMLAEERRADQRESLCLLNWHLRLIRLLQGVDAFTGWSRYTPLAAQAIRLGHLKFATSVLEEAANAASETQPAGRYMRRVREQKGLEWLLHRALVAVLFLERGNREAALPIFRELLDERLAHRLTPWLRPLKCYELRARGKMGTEELVDGRVGAMNAWSETHSAYFPRWSLGMWEASGTPS